MKIIDTTKVSYGYTKESQVLNDISLEVSPGECLGIIGPNGAGKSTLLLILAGLLKPTSGNVNVFGESTLNPDFSQIRRHIGVVFQDPDDQLFNTTVLDDVLYSPLNAGIPRGEAEELALEALQSVNALHLKDRRPHRLSLGEKHRVAIASALVLKPKLLLLDEPTANLDSVSRQELIHLLQELNEHGTTVVISTHDLGILPPIVNRIITLNNGRITSQGTMREILTDDTLFIKTGLTPPDIISLYLRLKKAGLTREVAYSVEEAYNDLTHRLAQTERLPCHRS